MTLLEELQLFQEVEIKYVSRWGNQSENRKAVEYLKGRTSEAGQDKIHQRIESSNRSGNLKF